MIRHIFIATFKSNISEEIKAEALNTFKNFSKDIPQVVNAKSGLSTGWIGAANQVVLTVDFDSKADFDIYMKHPKHLELIDKAQKIYFESTSFTVAQFEF